MPYYLLEGQSENDQERPCESYPCSDCPESQCYRGDGYCITSNKNSNAPPPPSAPCPPSSPEPKESWPPLEPGECEKFVTDICSNELNSFEECNLCIMKERDELNNKGCDGEKSVKACRNLTQEIPIEKDIDLSEKLKELMQISDNFAPMLIKQINKINDQTSNKLYSDKDKRYVKKISEMSLIDLGDPGNSDELDFLENLILMKKILRSLKRLFLERTLDGNYQRI